MYFNVSEHIARKTTFSRSDIKKIDSFLARPNARRFTLHNVQDNTEVTERNAKLILEEYVRKQVVVKNAEYSCPVHDIFLQPVNKQEGECIDCEKRYLFEDCKSEIIYERKKAPDKITISQSSTRLVQNGKHEDPWWKDKKWILGSIILPIIFCIAPLIASHILSSTNSTISMPPLQTQTPSPTLSSPTMTATPTSSVTATNIASPTQKIELTITSEPTASIPPNPVITPSP